MSDVSRSVSIQPRKIIKITPKQKPSIMAIYTDGKPSSKSKPCCLFFATMEEDGKFINRIETYDTSNVISCNEAKFLAVKWALDWLAKRKQKKRKIIIYTNLEMLVEVIKGKKKIHTERLKSIYDAIVKQLSITNAKVEWSGDLENRVFLQ